MPQATREIKRRIRSIKNTRQITKAMELVSAAKMRRAVQNVLATRTYSNLAWELIKELAKRTDVSRHPLLVSRAVKKIGIIVVTSNRGLCGGFNNQLVQRVADYVIKQKSGLRELEIDMVTVGKRGRDILLRSGNKVAAEFTKADITNNLAMVTPIARLVIDDYLAGRYDKVIVAYTDFISAITQKPRLKQILPIESEPDPYLGAVRSAGINTEASQTKNEFNYEYLFEPSADEVLEDLLPRLLEIQIYQALLESDASEHSARMLSMRNASDAAKDMIDSLTLAFNQARQASITAELADITGGRAAIGG